MSPNAYVCFNDSGLLVGYQGEELNEEPCFTWTYSEFEEHLCESITPSMYHFMANYVYSKINKEILYEIQGGDYSSGRLEEEAVEAYFCLPWQERQEMHEQTLVNLNEAKRTADAKEKAALDWMLEADQPSAIHDEVCDFVRGLVVKYRCLSERLENEIQEEEQWRGGWEDGASQTDGPRYDEMDEP